MGLSMHNLAGGSMTATRRVRTLTIALELAGDVRAKAWEAPSRRRRCVVYEEDQDQVMKGIR